MVDDKEDENAFSLPKKSFAPGAPLANYLAGQTGHSPLLGLTSPRSTPLNWHESRDVGMTMPTNKSLMPCQPSGRNTSHIYQCYH